MRNIQVISGMCDIWGILRISRIAEKWRVS